MLDTRIAGELLAAARQAGDLWNRFRGWPAIRHEAEHAAGSIRRSIAAQVYQTLTLSRSRNRNKYERR
jgi:hypothetical protein